ncbi:MAG: peptide chain release factor 1 [Verrucomicrobiales bacterium]
MDYAPLITKKRARFEELEAMMAVEGFYDDARRAGELSREYNRLKKLLELWDGFVKTGESLRGNEELAKGDDEEMAALAKEEIPELTVRCAELDLQIQYALLPPDEMEHRDAIVEIRAGTGGDEASLFASDLLRLYTRYAEMRGWKLEPLEASPSDVGGFKEVVFKISGEEVFRFLRYESGVHRVQRVPETETQGRIHTSTATVAVLPEAQEVDVELKADEIRVEVCRASGPGGQGVNTTDSAVQVTHQPTGIVVRCQDGRSQIKNKEKALTILRSRILERKQQEEAEKYSSQRRSLIGSGGREEKIRTYNFPQSRVTDHRVGLTLYNLDGVMDGGIDELVARLQSAEMEERLAEAGLAAS